jgi:hypothetical protein
VVEASPFTAESTACGGASFNDTISQMMDRLLQFRRSSDRRLSLTDKIMVMHSVEPTSFAINGNVQLRPFRVTSDNYALSSIVPQFRAFGVGQAQHVPLTVSMSEPSKRHAAAYAASLDALAVLPSLGLSASVLPSLFGPSSSAGALSLAVPGTLTLSTYAAAGHPAAVLGAVGALGLAVTPAQAAASLAGEPVTFPIADPILVDLMGRLRAGVSAQDLWWYLWPEIKTATASRPGARFGIEFVMNEAEAPLALPDRVALCQMAHLAGLAYCTFSGNGAAAALLAKQGRAPHAALLQEYTEACLRPDLDAFSLTKLLSFDLSEVDPVLVGPGSLDRRVPVTVPLPPAAAGRLTRKDAAAYAAAARHTPLVQSVMTPFPGAAVPPAPVAAAVISGSYAELAPIGMHAVQLFASRNQAWRGHLRLAAPVVLVIPECRADYIALRANGYVAALEAVGARVYSYQGAELPKADAGANTAKDAPALPGDVNDWVLSQIRSFTASGYGAGSYNGALVPVDPASPATVVITATALTSAAPLANPSPLAAGVSSDPYNISAAFPHLSVTAASPLVAFSLAASGDLRSPVVEGRDCTTISMPARRAAAPSSVTADAAADSDYGVGWFEINLPRYTPTSAVAPALRADRFQRSFGAARAEFTAGTPFADLDGVWALADGGRTATLAVPGEPYPVSVDAAHGDIGARCGVSAPLVDHFCPPDAAAVRAGPASAVSELSSSALARLPPFVPHPEWPSSALGGRRALDTAQLPVLFASDMPCVPASAFVSPGATTLLTSISAPDAAPGAAVALAASWAEWHGATPAAAPLPSLAQALVETETRLRAELAAGAPGSDPAGTAATASSTPLSALAYAVARRALARFPTDAVGPGAGVLNLPQYTPGARALSAADAATAPGTVVLPVTAPAAGGAGTYGNSRVLYTAVAVDGAAFPPKELRRRLVTLSPSAYGGSATTDALRLESAVAGNAGVPASVVAADGSLLSAASTVPVAGNAAAAAAAAAAGPAAPYALLFTHPSPLGAGSPVTQEAAAAALRLSGCALLLHGGIAPGFAAALAQQGVLAAELALGARGAVAAVRQGRVGAAGGALLMPWSAPLPAPAAAGSAAPAHAQSATASDRAQSALVSAAAATHALLGGHGSSVLLPNVTSALEPEAHLDFALTLGAAPGALVRAALAAAGDGTDPARAAAAVATGGGSGGPSHDATDMPHLLTAWQPDAVGHRRDGYGYWGKVRLTSASAAPAGSSGSDDGAAASGMSEAQASGLDAVSRRGGFFNFLRTGGIKIIPKLAADDDVGREKREREEQFRDTVNARARSRSFVVDRLAVAAQRGADVVADEVAGFVSAFAKKDGKNDDADDGVNKKDGNSKGASAEFVSPIKRPPAGANQQPRVLFNARYGGTPVDIVSLRCGGLISGAVRLRRAMSERQVLRETLIKEAHADVRAHAPTHMQHVRAEGPPGEASAAQALLPTAARGQNSRRNPFRR